MVYPTFTVNTKAFNIASISGYSPYYDIVWSFEYAISGNSSTEAGFTIFLMDNNYVLSGGNFNIDLGYSGLSSNNNQSSSIKPGISGAKLAVGFDTTGLFAVSAMSGTRVLRDGISETLRIPNSIIMRNGWPSYSYNTYSYNAAISNIDTSFRIVETSVKYKTIRARLGNVGRTLYVDYRNYPDEDFKPLFEQNVNLNIAADTLYKVGASFATPISSNNNNSVGTIYFKNFHTEGSAVSGDSSSFIAVATSVYLSSNIPLATTPSIKPVEPLPDISIPVSDNSDVICPTPYMVYGHIATQDNSELSSDPFIFSEDRYNFGYTLDLTFWSLTGVSDIYLNRTQLFKYISADSKYIIYKANLCSSWHLSSSTLFLTNTSTNPIGFYDTDIAVSYL